MDTSVSYSECSLTSTNGDEIQLSITRNYAQHWETWEGVREMVQNWHDGLFSGSENITKEELKFVKVLIVLTCMAVIRLSHIKI